MRFGVTVCRLVPLLLIAGCAPPSLGPPSIKLLYPQPGSEDMSVDDGGTPHMALDEDGVLRFTTVVSMENIEFVPPATDPVDGEAHWHVFVDTDYDAPDALFQESEFAMESSGVGALHTLKVQLQRNDHADLDCLSEGGCADADVSDTIEFMLDPFGG